LTVAKAGEATGKAKAMDVTSAAMRRDGPEQWLIAVTTRPANEAVRRPTEARMQWFRLTRPPCHIFLPTRCRNGAQVQERIGAPLLIPPQMPQAVCPPTGI